MKGRDYTREDIIKALDAHVAKNVKQWGEDYIYTRWAKEYREDTIARYDEGEVVMVEKEYCCEDGMEFIVEFYSDGSASKICYGYMD